MLKKNDAIVQVNGTVVKDDQSASNLIRSSPGDVTFVVRRKPPELGRKSSSRLKLFKRSSSKKSSKDMIANGAADTPKVSEQPAQTPPPPAAEEEEDDELLADATESVTLYIARKHGQFGIGVRDDNFVQEVDEGSGAAEAGFLPGDWIVSIGGFAVADYQETLPHLKAIKLDAVSPVVVRYNPTKYPDRVVPPMPAKAAPAPAPVPAPAPAPAPVPVPAPAPAPAPVPAPVAAPAPAPVAVAAPVPAPVPVLSAAQLAAGAFVVSLFKPEEGSRLGITLTSSEAPDAPLYISKLAVRRGDPMARHTRTRLNPAHASAKCLGPSTRESRGERQRGAAQSAARTLPRPAPMPRPLHPPAPPAPPPPPPPPLLLLLTRRLRPPRARAVCVLAAGLDRRRFRQALCGRHAASGQRHRHQLAPRRVRPHQAGVW